jgi:hypothetical protein
VWPLFPRVRADLPVRKWLQVLRGLLRERKTWPLPARAVHGVEPRRQAAEAAGLTNVSGERTVSGHSGDLLVILADRARAPGTRVEIRGFMSRLSLKLEGIDSAIQKRMGRTEMEVGDDAFDRTFFVQGDTYVRAVLDADLRRAILRAFGGRLRDDSRWAPAPAVVDTMAIEGGALVAELHDTTSLTADPLEVSLAGLLDIARRLQAPEATVAGLARNATADPEAGVRLHNLRALVREYASDEATARVLEDAADDESQQVRLTAARARGPAGREALLALAAEGWTDDAIAADALEALGSHVPEDRALLVLDHALEARKHATAAACLRALGRVGGRKAVARLRQNVAHRETPVARAAIEGLGSAGSVDDVPRLRELEAHGEGTLSSAARQAVASIQARLAGASPGQLAIAGEGGAGGLSLTDDGSGRVTLGPEPPER